MANYRRQPARRRNAAWLAGLKDWLKGQLSIRPLPVWSVIVIDVLVFAIALLTFAYFHHVMPRKADAVGRVSQRGGGVTTMESTSTAAPTLQPEVSAAPEISIDQIDASRTGTADADISAQTDGLQQDAANATSADVDPVPEPTQDPIGYFGTKFADKFTDGEVIKTDTSYQSDNVNITLTAYDEQGVQFWVADIYIKDIACFQTAFARDTFGQGYSEWPADLNERLGGIVAINGDYYGARKDGTVIRNGVLYREDAYPDRDMCVLYWDGTMETYPGGSFDVDAAMERGAYQSWNFGPMLLDENGQPMTSFNSDVTGNNPRTAVGYYEPGHYCFVVADGRTGSSKGLSMKNLSLLMYTLGCKRAYNLDGGQTSEMVVGGTVVNNPFKDGRKCSDILMIVDP